MIGLILIYNVGKVFYELAELHGKNRWIYAVWGVASYYLGVIVGGILLGIMLMAYSETILEGKSDTVIGLLGIPVGILVCWANYRFLKKRWEGNEVVEPNSDLLDHGL